MAVELKHNETRGWQTDYRGPLAIHAAKITNYLRYYLHTRWQSGGIGATIVDALKSKGLERIEQFPLGAIVGVTNVIDCVITAQLDDLLSPAERILGNYDDGRYAWITEGMLPLSMPIPERGHQGFWNWQPPADFELAYEDAIPVGKWVRR